MSAVLHVDVPAGPGVDVAVDALWTAGALGVHEEARADGSMRLVTAFDPSVDPAAVAQELRARVPAAVVTVVDDDGSWWDAWRAHAEPVVAGDGAVVVVPSWWTGAMPAEAATARAVVRVDPGHTFGSGAHATTRLVLDALTAADLDGARVLDVGGGSGVLSVVAVALGASTALAVDVDEACVGITAANARANDVADRVVACTEPLGHVAGPFDVVVANVLLPVLEALAPEIDRLAARLVVVSGLLTGTEARVLRALPSWHATCRTERDGWACLWLSRGRSLAEANEDLT